MPDEEWEAGMSEFAGKVIVITGGGSGIGRGTALFFAREKSHVAVIDWNDSNSLETVNLIQGAGGQGLFIKADVSNATEVQQAVQVIVERFAKNRCPVRVCGSTD